MAGERFKLAKEATAFRWRYLTTRGGRWLLGAEVAALIIGLPLSSSGSTILSLAGWATWLFGAVGLAYRFWPRRATLHRLDPSEIREFLTGVELPSTMTSEGYEVSLDHLGASSSALNAVIRRGKDWALNASPEAANRLATQLVDDSFREKAVSALRAHVQRATRARKQLTNDSKIGLASELRIDEATAQIKATSYFATLLTNDLSVAIVRDGGTRPIVDGRDDVYPIITDLGSGIRRLLDLSAAPLGNHLGASILVITVDDKLVIWRQGSAAQHSEDQLAPSGSGSADASDFQSGSLITAMKMTMQRELDEESTERGYAPPTPLAPLESIWVIGHYRNLYRAGKPDFFGVARIDTAYHDLDANIDELVVDAHSEQVSNLEELDAACVALLERPQLSLVLVAHLLALREAIAEDPKLTISYLYPEIQHHTPRR